MAGNLLLNAPYLIRSMPYFVPDVAVKVAARSVNLFGMGVGYQNESIIDMDGLLGAVRSATAGSVL